MSKVKITGHASGSGVLTVTAPNTSTDRTITLPDSTGTILDNTSTLDATKLSGNLPAISAASLTNVPKDTTVGGRKNLFINGGFDVWQRGTSLAGASKFLADRWFNTTSGTQSRQTFTAGQTDVPHNPTYYYRQVTGSTEWFETRQKIENVGITAGRAVTLSYWMKGSSAFTNAPYQVQNFGGGGSSEVNAALSTASVTTSWAKYTHTFTPASVSGKTIGTNSYLQIHVLRANINNLTVEIANVQLEFGSVATDFEQRSIGEELTLCQRYYCTSFNLGATHEDNAHDGPVAAALAYSATVATVTSIPFPSRMRATPSLTLWGRNAGTGNFAIYKSANWTATTTHNGGTNHSHLNLYLQPSGGGMTAHNVYQTAGHYEADAELQEINMTEYKTIITNAKYKKLAIEDTNGSIEATIDGVVMSVPLDTENRHYAEIIKQVADGDITIAEAD